jgi:hypothetical protein
MISILDHLTDSVYAPSVSQIERSSLSLTFANILMTEHTYLKNLDQAGKKFDLQNQAQIYWQGIWQIHDSLKAYCLGRGELQLLQLSHSNDASSPDLIWSPTNLFQNRLGISFKPHQLLIKGEFEHNIRPSQTQQIYLDGQRLGRQSFSSANLRSMWFWLGFQQDKSFALFGGTLGAQTSQTIQSQYELSQDDIVQEELSTSLQRPKQLSLELQGPLGLKQYDHIYWQGHLTFFSPARQNEFRMLLELQSNSHNVLVLFQTSRVIRGDLLEPLDVPYLGLGLKLSEWFFAFFWGAQRKSQESFDRDVRLIGGQLGWTKTW